ncbi:MAG: hypothetical protein JSR76_07080 [Verrucomicrobia bacterium]|nr:hypothetical protein [Verrucomicrobiota bacterium]
MSTIGNIGGLVPSPSPHAADSIDRLPPPPPPTRASSVDLRAEVDGRIGEILGRAIPCMAASSSTSSHSSKLPVEGEDRESPPPGLLQRAPAFVRSQSLTIDARESHRVVPNLLLSGVAQALGAEDAGESAASPPAMLRKGAEDAKQEGAG